MNSIEIKFWGVRGSIPTPGPSTLKYGGNTSCVSLQFNDGTFFILDAGTGIRELGKELLKRKNNLTGYIFLSHFHWDHIQGLPFFRPAFVENNSFTIYGSDDTTTNLDQIISFQMNPTYFPIAIQDMKANIRFESIKEEIFSINNVKIQSQYLNHPGYALGYRISYQEKTVVYISDNEPFNYTNSKSALPESDTDKKNLIEIFDSFCEDKDDKLIQFCHQADILIHDTQFLPEEYENKVTWGHSPYNFSVDLALQSQVKQIILFHHDPDHDDGTIDLIERLSQEHLRKTKNNLICKAAREGMVIHL
jgi:phosphoribosyl 1,2-cyclic phosphodiesterase